MSFRTAVSALILVAAPLAAQEPSRIYVTTPRAVEGRAWTVMPDRTMASHRGVIGVGVDLRPSANDSLGAAGAGIVAGDIITKFDGTALVERGRRPAGDDDGEEPQSQPGLRLLELASRMSPGDTVAVEWKHERQRKTARLVEYQHGNLTRARDAGDHDLTGRHSRAFGQKQEVGAVLQLLHARE